MIDNVEVLWPRRVVSRVKGAGSSGGDEIDVVFRALAVLFPAA